MGSTGNPNPWGTTYDSYRDCSQGVCSVYCPQWCYVIFPPPPSFYLDDEDDSSSSDFSPLLIALIGILASAFILVSYYTLISKYCHRRRHNSSSTSAAAKCNHAFHVPCIDTWLKSHSNCPLCRAFIVTSSAVEIVDLTNQQIVTENNSISTGDDSVVVVNLDLENSRSRNETVNEGSTPKPPEMQDSRDGEERRSASLNSGGGVVSIADILREIEDDEESAGVGTSRWVEEGEGEKTPPPSGSAANQTNGISNFLVRSSMAAMKRSGYDRAKNYRLPK